MEKAEAERQNDFLFTVADLEKELAKKEVNMEEVKHYKKMLEEDLPYLSEEYKEIFRRLFDA